MVAHRKPKSKHLEVEHHKLEREEQRECQGNPYDGVD
jgi:hypothetical protein